MINTPQGHLVLNAVVDAIAVAAGLPLPTDATVRLSLFAHVAEEARAEPIYTVLRIFGATPIGSGPNAVAVQATTTGRPAISAMGRAAQIFAALLADDGDGPRLAWRVGTDPQWLVDVFELEEPRAIGTDEVGRVDVASNWIMAYRRVPTLQPQPPL